jgi:hypothetical protein
MATVAEQIATLDPTATMVIRVSGLDVPAVQIWMVTATVATIAFYAQLVTISAMTTNSTAHLQGALPALMVTEMDMEITVIWA